MSAFTISVTVECETLEQAEQVAAERLSHDEDYGFDYHFGYTVVERDADEAEEDEPITCQCSDPFTASLTGHGHACPLYDEKD